MPLLKLSTFNPNELPQREITEIEKLFSHATGVKTAAAIQIALKNIKELGFKSERDIDLSRPYGIAILDVVNRGCVLGNTVLLPYLESLRENFTKDIFFELYIQPLLGNGSIIEKSEIEETEHDGFTQVNEKKITEKHKEFSKSTNLKFVLSQLKETPKDGTPNLSKVDFLADINTQIDQAYTDKTKSSRIIIPCIVSHDHIDHNVTIVIDTNHTKTPKEDPKILFFDPQGFPVEDTKNNKIGKKEGYTIQTIVNDIKVKLAEKSDILPAQIKVHQCQKVQEEYFVCGDHNILLSTQLAAGYSFENIYEKLLEHRKIEDRVRIHAAKVLKIGYDNSAALAKAGAAAASAAAGEDDDGFQFV
jgi:hypothetical protein